MVKVTYIPNRFEDIKLTKELLLDTETPWLLVHVTAFADLNVDYRHAICKNRITLYVNEIEIDVDSWNSYEIKDDDIITIVPTIEGGGGGLLNTVLGAVLIVVGVALQYVPGVGTFLGYTAAQWGAGLIISGAMMSLGGVVQMLFGPSDLTLPTFGGSDSPTYTWEGIQLTAITDRPIGVCYGEHDIGGNVISAFVTSSGSKNYLNLLIGLCEGEIEGIMKSDGSGVCTANTDIPDITVNGQALANYSSDVWWDYRLGTNTQTSIPGFNYTHTYYNDGRKITPTGISYTTSIENCNELQVKVECPTLFKMDGSGNTIKNSVTYQIFYRLHGTTTWLYPRTGGYVLNPAWTAWETAWKASTRKVPVITEPNILGYSDITWVVQPFYGWEGSQVQINLYVSTLPQHTYYKYEEWINGSVNRTPIPEGPHPEPPKSVWDENLAPTSYTMEACSRTAVREYRNLRNLPSGKYDIQIKRLSPEETGFKSGSDLYLEGIDEVTYNDLSYPNTALLAFRMLATDQLSGNIPNIVTHIRGRKVRVPKLTCNGILQTYNNCYWDNTLSKYIAPISYAGNNQCILDTTYTNWPVQWTQNPLWCLVDFLTNKRYGLGEYITDSLFDWTYLVTAAKYADTLVDSLDGLGTLEKRFMCDGIWDTSQSAMDTISEFCHIFRAWVIWSEGKLKFLVDKADTPNQLFNMSNIISGSYSQTFASKAEKANYIEVQFADKDDDYKLTTREIADQEAWSTGEAQNKQSLSLKGVVRQSQAIREAKFYLNSAKYRTKLISFKGTLNSVHCQAGDTISFQHDVPQWAYGGRIVTASLAANTITLDSDVTVASSNSYKLFFQSSGDTFNTATVVNASGVHRNILLSPTLTATTLPSTDGVWSFGTAGNERKDFKILSISKDKDNEVVVSALEYNESVYSDTGEVISTQEISTLPNPKEPPGPVTDLVLVETINRPGFRIAFNIPESDMRFSHARVLLSYDESTYFLYTTSYSAADIEVTGLPGQTIYVKIESCNSFGTSSYVSDRVSQITLGSSYTPKDTTGLEIAGNTVTGTDFEGKDCKIQWKRSTGAVSEFPDGTIYNEFLDYKVEVVVGGKTVRSEYTTDIFYTYTYEHNIEDNTIPAPSFTFKVWVRNTGLILSTNPATITVTNTVPDNVSGLTAVAIVGGVQFSWSKNDDVDLFCYRYRIQVEDDGWSDWTSITENSVHRTLTSTEITSHTNLATIYIEVKARDVFYQDSAIAVSANEKSNTISDNIFQLVGSKSSGVSGTVSDLYNGVLDSGGVTIA